ncbi:MAG: hypothetical protein P1U75_14380 [Antarcticimicrobium sp.]|uniref:hypothetical protein n=1 Tax=Antarcticimicrobium sp. TaxID=2824147 RepID=UPI002603CA1D|nr:hypothetical protein [Antarcticimicrobium sp.]MDF1717839.1 hypothetical protein [Antarcticimicrobium sp.]
MVTATLLYATAMATVAMTGLTVVTLALALRTAIRNLFARRFDQVFTAPLLALTGATAALIAIHLWGL